MKNFCLIAVVAAGAAASAFVVSALAAEMTVVQQDLAFSPGQVSLKAGDKLTFQNRDEYGHNVYSATPGSEFDVGLQEPGQSRSVEFKSAGQVEVRCRIHPRMRLLVTVNS